MKRLTIILLTVLMLLLTIGCTNNSETKDPDMPIDPGVIEPVDGGWSKVTDGTITDELKDIFNKALEGLLGAKYEPVELLETQVVAGTNYKFLANGTKTTSPITTGTYYVKVNKDLEGNCTLLDIETIEEKQEEVVITEEEKEKEEESKKDPSQYDYWVVFFNSDGVALQRKAMKYGSVPKYEGETPVYWDSEYWYRFIGWTDKYGKDVEEFKPIHGNTYFYAKYEIGGDLKPANPEPNPEPTCLASGTLITMADGSKRAVETLKTGDEVVVFDHDTGLKSVSKLIDFWQYEEPMSGAIKLKFTSGIEVTIVGGHCFYEENENKYVIINKANIDQYLGHKFYNVDKNKWETLLGYELIKEKVDTFIVVTDRTLNCSADGMLNIDDGIYYVLGSIFEFDKNLMIDANKKNADIDKWGLWDFSNSKYLTEEAYNQLNLQYLNVAIGKGLLTMEQYEELEVCTANYDSDFVREDKKSDNPIKSK